jgi:hypothetical protein
MPELHDAKKMSRYNAPLFIGLSLFFISVGLGRWRTSKTYEQVGKQNINDCESQNNIQPNPPLNTEYAG